MSNCCIRYVSDQVMITFRKLRDQILKQREQDNCNLVPPINRKFQVTNHQYKLVQHVLECDPSEPVFFLGYELV